MSRGVRNESSYKALPSLSVAAHELKSPLALMRQLSLVLGDESLSDQQRQKFSKQLVSVSNRALDLVDDLANSANLQPSLFPLEPVNPLAVCRNVQHEIIPISKMYNQLVVWPKSRNSRLVIANRKLLSRIVANFVNNAMKYTEPGTAVKVRVQQMGDVIRVGVRDYGPQISKSEYEKMIDEMAQKKSSRTRPDSSGLGVFISSQFAEVMNGRVGIVRHRDGLTFFVELPISKQMSLV